MRALILAVPALAFAPALAAAQEAVTEIWTLDGFATPESALYDAEGSRIFVSNVAGEMTEKDGEGFISIVSPDGEMVERDWLTGLDAPKGLAMHDGRLYAADIDRLVEIDIEAGEVAAEYEAAGAQFLNDVAVDGEGRVYVSDTATNTIWRLDGEAFEAWIEDEGLKGPNGLYVDGERLIVAAWGEGEGADAEGLGHLVEVSITEETVATLGSGEPVGNLDGLEAENADTFLVTDWGGGGLYRIHASGEAELLVDLPQGSADIGYMRDEGIVLVPLMMDGRLAAFGLGGE